MAIKIQGTDTVLPCPHCGGTDCTRQTEEGVHYCANTLYPITQTQVAAQLEKATQKPVIQGETSAGVSLTLGESIISLRWTNRRDPLWWVYDGEFLYTHWFDISAVKGGNFRAIQIVIGPVKLAWCWQS